MLEAFVLGGWAMWFILVFGLVALSGAVRFVWRGDPRLAKFAQWMCLTTFSSGLFGFTAGMIKVCKFVTHWEKLDERWTILVVGLGEALNCVALGILLPTLICLLIAVGHRRFPAQ